MTKHWCIIHISDGELVNKKKVIDLFHQLKNGKFLLEINQHNKRSSPQNRYYFGLVVPLIQNGIRDLGTEITKEETHEFLKAKFNYSEVMTKDGWVEHIPRSTTILNKEAFSNYISQIQQFAAEFLNVIIPDPGQQLEIEV